MDTTVSIKLQTLCQKLHFSFQSVGVPNKSNFLFARLERCPSPSLHQRTPSTSFHTSSVCQPELFSPFFLGAAILVSYSVSLFACSSLGRHLFVLPFEKFLCFLQLAAGVETFVFCKRSWKARASQKKRAETTQSLQTTENTLTVTSRNVVSTLRLMQMPRKSEAEAEACHAENRMIIHWVLSLRPSDPQFHHRQHAPDAAVLGDVFAVFGQGLDAAGLIVRRFHHGEKRLSIFLPHLQTTAVHANTHSDTSRVCDYALQASSSVQFISFIFSHAIH